MTNLRYVVVMRYDMCWYTLLVDSKPHVFFFKQPKIYKLFYGAKNMADTLCRWYKNNGVWVFRIIEGEELGVDLYKQWVFDRSRIAYHTTKDKVK